MGTKNTNNILIFVLAMILAYNVKAQLLFAPPSSASSIPSSSTSTSCVNQLYPCLKYLNSTHDPPDSCCEPLKLVIKSDAQCMCNIISTQGAFQAQLLGINISQVENLPGRCGQRVNPIACLSGAGGSKNSLHNSARSTVYHFPSLILFALGAVLMVLY